MSKKQRCLTVFLLSLLVLILDQASKLAAIHYLKGSDNIYRFWYDLFILVYAENKGAFLSLGATLSPGIRIAVMIGANTIILLCLALFIFKAKQMSLFMTTALSLILAGGLGNIIDRIFRGGIVVDFMNTGITLKNFSLRSGIFNVADLAIVAGLLMVVLHELLGSVHSEKKFNRKTE